MSLNSTLRIIFLAFIGFFLSPELSAQSPNLSSLRVAQYSLDSCTITLDSMSILPSSVLMTISKDTINPTAYSLYNNTITLDSGICKNYIGSPVSIEYRVFPFNIEKKYALLDSSIVATKDRVIYIGHDYLPYEQEESALIEGNNLNYNGSFSRGFSVGNSQSLVLNSNFNLQLGGDLGDGLKVVAAISDDNIPIQPEGNTQLLQEFDRVFIQVSKDGSAVTAGDYELFSPKENYFIKYQKKLKGLSASTTQKIGGAEIKSRGSFAVAKGKFRRQVLPTQEGNQGPYKLDGNNGERFLIIESGSERVYIDGILLTRGFEYDYVIDYNRAEITFTPSRLITLEARVVIEFEYKVQAYLRTLYAYDGQYKTDRVRLNLNFFNEQDSKNVGSDLDLDSTDIAILTASGDDLTQAFRPGIRNISDPDEVLNRNLYIQLPNQNTPDPSDSLLVYTPMISDSAVLAFFTEVEPGQGDYEIETGLSANGRVYKYVGQGMGKYSPQITLIPPEKRQMMSLGGEVNISDNTKINGELALSNFDVNRFSPVDDGNNMGFGANLRLQNEFSLDTSENISIASRLDFEQINAKFNATNPYRNPEFVRDWNIASTVRTREQLYGFTSGIKYRNTGSLHYTISKYNLQNVYDGNKHLINAKINRWGLNVQANISLLKTEGFGEKTDFFRPTIEISQRLSFLNNWKIKGLYRAEENKRRTIGNPDDLVSSSFKNAEYWSFLESPENDTYKFSLIYKIRTDDLPSLGSFLRVTEAREWQLVSQWTPSPKSALDVNFAWRTLDVDQPDLVSVQAKKTILTNINYAFSALQNAIRSTTTYGISSGQEPKLEFEFIQVVDEGTGTHIYLGDLNGDGIDQAEEYRISEFSDEANFVRISIYNNEFNLTNSQTLNQSLRLDFRKYLLGVGKKTNKIKKWISKFSTLSNFRITQKITEEGEDSGVSILSFDPNDPGLVSYSSLINNTLFFNKGNPTFDLQLGHRKSQNRLNQISGYNESVLTEVFSRLRLNIQSKMDLIITESSGRRIRDAEFFDLSDFEIKYFDISPEINYRPKTNLRLILKYSYQDRKQVIRDLETAISNTLGVEFTYRQASTSSLDMGISLVNVQYDGAPGSSIEYDLLDGLKDGKNFLWNAGFTRRLANNVDLNLSYNGRKTGTSNTVHIARAQIKATF